MNALVGERLAPTDAGECTKVVSWYRQGFGYEVRATLTNGESRELRFRRDDGRLDINLGRLTIEEIDRIDVAWPSSNLARATLIDTPGLASLSRGASVRTHDFLALDDEDRQSDADAVLYLMRHMHRRDAEFLEAFLDDSLANTSPVNAIAVLSRADEIGAGRPDALESAANIAKRYGEDERVQALCVSVLPVAGLLAETGATMQEHEAASLRALAAIDEGDLRSMLLSVDRFLEPETSDLLVETRHELLERLGLFGVRLMIREDSNGGGAVCGRSLTYSDRCFGARRVAGIARSSISPPGRWRSKGARHWHRCAAVPAIWQNSIATPPDGCWVRSNRLKPRPTPSPSCACST